MTREEAIEIIRKEYLCVDRECDIERSCGKCPYMMPTKEPILEAYKMAIQALSQEPCDDDYQTDMDEAWKQAKREPCDDVVSRQAVLDGIEELKQSPWATDKRGNGFEYLITEALDMVAFLCVKQEPSVRPQEQTGHWIRQDNTKEPLYGWYFCSECNSVIGDKTKFCSNCGAKMVEPQERSDKE